MGNFCSKKQDLDSEDMNNEGVVHIVDIQNIKLDDKVEEVKEDEVKEVKEDKDKVESKAVPVVSAPKKIVKKGVLIGINYTGTNNQLSGCINDSINIKNLLIKNNYLAESEITMMNDNSSGGLYPSKANMLAQMNSLIAFANANKDADVKLILTYSGHGSNMRDVNGDEEDRLDELLCPIDFDRSGFISDDYLKVNFIDKLPQNANLVLLMDACHSATIFDLRYNYTISLKDSYKAYTRSKDTLGQAILISGCRDNQTSADAYIDNSSQGAMTAAFLASFDDKISYRDLVLKMRAWLLKEEYDQVPQLSSGKYLDIKQVFMLGGYND